MAHTFVRSVAFGFVLTLTGIAAARRPPVLVKAQASVERVYATCPQRTTSGYRDMLARFSPELQPSPLVAVGAPFVAPPRRMADHLVLSCKAGTIHTGSGYRDMLWRFRSESDWPQLAANTRANAVTNAR
jgi:hypothetical protein